MSDANSFKERNDFYLDNGKEEFDKKYGIATKNTTFVMRCCPICDSKLYKLQSEHNGHNYQCPHCLKYYD